MSRKKRSTLTWLAVAGFAVMSSSSIVSPAFAFGATSDVHANVLIVNGQTWRTVPYVTTGGTTYFGIWYLQQLLSQYGIQNTWDGRNLNVKELPTLDTSAQTVLDGRPLTGSPTLKYAGETYVNLSSAAKAAGGSTQYISSSQTLIATIPASQGGANAITLHPTSNRSIAAPVTNHLSVLHPNQASNGTVISGTNVYENGQLWRHVPIVHRNATTFFGVWYLQQWLKSHGIQNQWDGKKLSITQLPSIHPNTTLQIAGGSAQTTLIAMNGDWYAPLSTLGSLGLVGQTSTPSLTQETSIIQGRLNFQGASFPVQQISVRNTVTHAHYYAPVSADGSFTVSVPAGSYETFALVGDGSPVYLVDPFVTTTGSTALTVQVPALPVGSQMTTTHATIVAGDAAITAEQLLSVGQMFEHVYGNDIRDTGIAANGRVAITLYASDSAYQQHFVDEGYSVDEAQQIATNSVAAEEGTGTISVSMTAFDTVDGLNILAHEFTHALIAHVSTQIPSWANEGIAWIEGIRGELDGSSDATLQQGLQWSQWLDIVAHQQQGDLLPLGESNPLSGNYNIESQDYYAVQQLVNQFGLPKYMAYIRTIDSDANAFQDVFGESFDTFSAQVTAALGAQANKADSGFTVQIRVLPGGPQQLYVINPNGQRQLVSGLQVGQVYAITCENDGTIQVQSTLHVTPASSLPVAQDGDWFIGSGGSAGSGGAADSTTASGMNRQEFDIEHQFAEPFLAQALLYDDSGIIVHAYPATSTPNGLQIVDVKGNA